MLFWELPSAYKKTLLKKRSLTKPLSLTMTLISLIVIGLTLVSWMISCTITFGSPFENTPEGNYDFFFYELEQTYAYNNESFNGLSLSKIQELERGGLNDSWNSLRDALNNVINIRINDPHLFSRYSPVPDLHIDDNEPLHTERGQGTEFDTVSPYLANNTSIHWIEEEHYLFYGIIKSDTKIGYIYLDSLVDNVGGSSRLGESNADFFGNFTDRILNDFASRGVDKIIIDIRSSAGGGVHRSKEIASRFVASKKTFMISENRTSKDSYTRVNETISPKGVTHFRDKPLIVLVNTLTCSAGEMFLLMLQQAEGYKTTVGTPTSGCAGTIIDRELPNGWIFTMTSSRTSKKDGVKYFKVGIRPEKEENIVTYGTNDDVLAKGILEINK